jgi:hypothetical protein
MTRCVFDWHGKCQLTKNYGKKTGKRCAKCKSYINSALYNYTVLLEHYKTERLKINRNIKIIEAAIKKEKCGC